MSSEAPLFEASLIKAEHQEALPEGYRFRPLERSDFDHGHLDVLRDLAYVGEISEQQWIERYDLMKKCDSTYYVLVIEDTNREPGKTIVGTGSLFVERKFLLKCAIQGHIEDIAIKADQQGKKLGIKLLQALGHISEQVGCYKTILDCSEKNEGFYIKCGYEKAGSEMQQYYSEEALEHGV